MRFELLDSLRGLAAVWVFLHHLHHTLHEPDHGWSLAAVGYLGVPMFFVISGYCVTSAARASIRRGESPARFLSRRALRVYPPYWAAVALATAVGAAAGTKVLQLGWTDWANFLALTRGRSTGGELPWHRYLPLNPVFWTLAIEVQFYVVVGLALLARRWFYIILAGVTIASLPFLTDEAAYRSGSFVSHWLFFALGAAVCALIEFGWTVVRKRVVAAAALAVMIAATTQVPTRPDGSAAMVLGEFAFATAFALALWAAYPGQSSNGLFSRVGRFLGAVSYSIYLTHVPLLPILIAVTAGLAVGRDWLMAALVLPAGCLLAYPFHAAFERPFLSGRSNAKGPAVAGGAFQ